MRLALLAWLTAAVLGDGEVSEVSFPVNRVVVISGGNRGLGLGIAKAVLEEDMAAHVVILAREEAAAKAAASELQGRATGVQCDVTSDASVNAAVDRIKHIGGRGMLSLVNNAGVAMDLPWTPPPWPKHAAQVTMDVNVYGVHRLTTALLPLLEESADGRVVFVASHSGRVNMAQMASEPRERLISDYLKWEEIDSMAKRFTREYEAAAVANAMSVGPDLPFLSHSGLYLQSYGFSKALVAAWSRVLAKSHPKLLSVSLCPGLVKTDMTHGYPGAIPMLSPDEAGRTPAWLAAGGPRPAVPGETENHSPSRGVAAFYLADRSVVSFIEGSVPPAAPAPATKEEPTADEADGWQVPPEQAVVSAAGDKERCGDGDADTPAIIIGAGRVGSLLKELGCEGDILLRRGDPFPSDAPLNMPIYVTPYNDQLPGIIDATPLDRRKDLVFMQNGMLLDYLARLGLRSNTQAILYLAIETVGSPVMDGITELNPEGLTCAKGEHAPAFCARLNKGGLRCTVKTEDDYYRAMIEKLIWSCTFMLVGVIHGGKSVGETEAEHSDQVRLIIEELLAAAEKQLDLTMRPGALARLRAYARSIAHYPTAIKEFSWRNGWFQEISRMAVAQGVPDPMPEHTRALMLLEEKRWEHSATPIDDLLDQGGSWFSEWKARLHKWFIALPIAQAQQINNCIGALGLHLAQRLDTKMNKPKGNLLGMGGQIAAPPPAPRMASQTSCETVTKASKAMDSLPDFPEMPSKFALPETGGGFGSFVIPIPRLLPAEGFQNILSERQRLHLLAMQQGGAPTHAREQQQQQRLPTTASFAASAAAGAGGAGIALAAALGLVLLVRRSSNRGRAGRRHVHVTGGGAAARAADSQNGMAQKAVGDARVASAAVTSHSMMSA